jgi:hypothetical protein
MSSEYINYQVTFLDTNGDVASSPYLLNINYVLQLIYQAGFTISNILNFQINFSLVSPTGNTTINFEYTSTDPNYPTVFNLSPNFTGNETGWYKISNATFTIKYVVNFTGVVTTSGDVYIINNNYIYLTNGLNQMNVKINENILYTDTIYRSLLLVNMDSNFTSFYTGSYYINIIGFGNLFGYVPLSEVTNQLTITSPVDLITNTVESFNISGYADTNPGGTNTLNITLNFNPPTISSEIFCFLENTNLVCLINGKETLINIKEIKKGTLVKIYGNKSESGSGFAACEFTCFSNFENNPENINIKNKLYINKETNLILSGGHSLLVDELCENNEMKQKRYFPKKFKILDKFQLLACVSDDFEIYKNNDVYTIYSIILASNNENDKFGIYANGEINLNKTILIENMSMNFFINKSGMKKCF